MQTLVDVFPINFDLQKFPLNAFIIKADNADEIGATFASNIRKLRNVPAAWIKEDKRLITPANFSQENIDSVLNEIWDMQTKEFELVTGTTLEKNWHPSANTIAQFVVMGILSSARKEVKIALKEHQRSVKIVLTKRDYELKGLVVNGEPSLQITIHSPISSTKKLTHLYKSQQPESINGLLVKCGDNKGKVEGVIGTLGEARPRLLRYKPTTYDSKLLEPGQLPDNTPMVRIRKLYGDKYYDYPIDVLELVVDFGGLKALGLNQDDINKVTNWTKIAPVERQKITSIVRDTLDDFCQRQHPQIAIQKPYNSTTYPDLFATSDDLEFDTQLCFGNDVGYISRDTDMLKALKNYGLYRKAHETINVAVLSVVPHSQEYHSDLISQLKRFVGVLKGLGVEIKRAGEPIIMQDFNDPIGRRAELIRQLKTLIRRNPNIILVYLPQSDQQLSEDDESSLYNTVKSECIYAGIASQVIYEDTAKDSWADDNIIMGILGKTGNVPFVLAQELDYADVVVGLDISRSIKKKGVGTDNFAAMSRIYTNQGALIGYRVGSMSVEGETLTRGVLERILSEEEFGGKRTIIHRDGPYRGREIDDIFNWGEYIGAQFMPLSITKSGAGRFYLNDDNRILQAQKGAAFIRSPQSAYLVSSPPPSGKNGAFSTAIPLQITNYSSLTLRQALHSVLSLTLLHYGSVRSTRLPVSTHASDKIAGFLSRNIHPDKSIGDIPFWL